MSLYYDELKTPIGNIYVVVNDNKVVSIDIGKDNFDKNYELYKRKYNKDIVKHEKILKPIIQQIKNYFDGNTKEFDVEFDLKGTQFQQSVYKAMLKIPYGKTMTYSDIAKAINNEKAVRAIGQACKANPIPIIVPCHRVVGKNNKLGGYMGSHTDLKETLLKLENEHLKQDNII